jgi:cholesterol oxidase
MVLEQGQRWPIALAPFSRNFPPDGRSTWLRTNTILPFGPSLPISKHTGVLDRVDYENMKVYRGTAVGGGSIIYGGISVQPPEDLFYKIFPRGTSYQELQPYYERVRYMLRITTVPADIEAQPHYDYTRVFAKHAANAGLEATPVEQATDWDIVRSEIAGSVAPSVIIGETFYGNNSGCKNSLDQNYLPMAEATGYVTIHPLHRVIDITQENSGKYAVTVEQINEAGEMIQTKKITAIYLFLAAGSVGTTELLVKARELDSLPNLNEEVGNGWGTNGNCTAYGFLDHSLKEDCATIQSH